MLAAESVESGQVNTQMGCLHWQMESPEEPINKMQQKTCWLHEIHISTPCLHASSIR